MELPAALALLEIPSTILTALTEDVENDLIFQSLIRYKNSMLMLGIDAAGHKDCPKKRG
jgi:hypothetical protein